jgi:hypothetical protein
MAILSMLAVAALVASLSLVTARMGLALALALAGGAARRSH